MADQIVQLKDRYDDSIKQYPVTLEAAVLDSDGTTLSTNLESIRAVANLKANIQSLDISYDSDERLIILSHGGVTLGTVDCTAFIIQSSLTAAEYVTEGQQGEEGEFLKLTFGTDDIIYVNLEPIVLGALDSLVERIVALEERDVWLTEDDYAALEAAGLIDPDKVYHTYEEEV